MRSSKIGYLIREGFRNITTHGFMSFASVTIIIACLVIMGSFSLIAVNIDSILGDLEAENQVVAYVEETLPEEQARALQPQIEYLSNVRLCRFVSRQEAMEEFASTFEDQSLFQDVDASGFRDRYIIYLNDLSLMEQTQQELYDIIGIASVDAHLGVAEGFLAVRNVFSVVSLVLVVVLVIVSVFIMSNTIKLATLSRREEIAIMRMVGASNAFIRFPFFIEGLVMGLLGSLIAFLAEWGIYDVVANSIMNGALGRLVNIIPFSELSSMVLLIYLGVGLGVGIFGSSIAIRNYLQV